MGCEGGVCLEGSTLEKCCKCWRCWGWQVWGLYSPTLSPSGWLSISLGKIGPLTFSELFPYAKIIAFFIFSGHGNIVVHLGHFDLFPPVDFSCPSISYYLSSAPCEVLAFIRQMLQSFFLNF